MTMGAYIMPRPEDAAQNLRNMASDHKFAFVHSVVCRQASDKLDMMRIALAGARFKLARYREVHGKNLVGGYAAECDAVVAAIDKVLEQ